ncbi:hypothetical protein [Psychrobacter sp. NPDC078631]|uniref:hypothetical protein n=1 Tax=Psychrobacter sp. NPDC078631 TaxID=3390666 RepID=UPI003CFD2199
MNKFFKMLILILDDWRFTIVKIILISLYGLILIGYSTSRIADEISKLFFGSFLMNHPIPIILTATIVAILYQALYKFLEAKTKSKNDKGMVSAGLLAALERPVNKKRERFAKEVDNFVRSKTTKYTTNNVFKAITKPENQSELILEALELFFKHTYEDIEFKIGLMNIKNNSVDTWKYFLPLNRPPRTSLDQLRLPESTISRCIKSMQIEIVQDVRKEISRQKQGVNEATCYVKGATSETEDWSQLCYPLISVTTKEVIYVITIAASQKNFFKNNEKKHFEWVLERFAIRLALEHSLECLLEKRL